MVFSGTPRGPSNSVPATLTRSAGWAATSRCVTSGRQRVRGLCQRCHLLHDLPFDRVQRWLTFRRRWAVGDLFLGLYEMQMSLPLFSRSGLEQAVMMIRGGRRDSWRSAQVPMAARTQNPLALQLPLISMGR